MEFRKVQNQFENLNEQVIVFNFLSRDSLN